MSLDINSFSVGDLVTICQDVEWDSIIATENEVAVVIEIYGTDDEKNFFDLLLLLGDGGRIPVWTAEVEKIKCE